MDNDQGISFKISKKLKARIQEYARQNGFSQAVAMRILMTDALNRAGIPDEVSISK